MTTTETICPFDPKRQKICNCPGRPIIDQIESIENQARQHFLFNVATHLELHDDIEARMINIVNSPVQDAATDRVSDLNKKLSYKCHNFPWYKKFFQSLGIKVKY
jgi:hypothetical protein